MTQHSTPANSGVEASVARPGGVSYLRIPAHDLAQSAEFYRAVFGGGAVLGHRRGCLPRFRYGSTIAE